MMGRVHVCKLPTCGPGHVLRQMENLFTDNLHLVEGAWPSISAVQGAATYWDLPLVDQHLLVLHTQEEHGSLSTVGIPIRIGDSP